MPHLTSLRPEGDQRSSEHAVLPASPFPNHTSAFSASAYSLPAMMNFTQPHPHPLSVPSAHIQECLPSSSESIDFLAHPLDLQAAMSHAYPDHYLVPQKGTLALELSGYYGNLPHSPLPTCDSFLYDSTDRCAEYALSAPRTLVSLDPNDLQTATRNFSPAVFQCGQLQQETYLYQSECLKTSSPARVYSEAASFPTSNDSFMPETVEGSMPPFHGDQDMTYEMGYHALGNVDLSLSSSPAPESRHPESVTSEPPLDKDLPYARLLHRCLMSAPDHTMVLKDIYEWFRQNTDKGKDPIQRGWQNSIRHNLSMNKAFTKVDQPQGPDGKRGYKWKLEDRAIREGIKSTTRYRAKLPSKRGFRSSRPDARRQASGAKGGQATRKSAERLRRSSARLTTPSSTAQFVCSTPATYPACTSAYHEQVCSSPIVGENGILYQDQPFLPSYLSSHVNYHDFSDSTASSPHGTHISTPLSVYADDPGFFDLDPYCSMDQGQQLNRIFCPGRSGPEYGHDDAMAAITAPSDTVFGGFFNLGSEPDFS